MSNQEKKEQQLTKAKLARGKAIKAKEGYNIKIELATLLGIIMCIINTGTGFMAGDYGKGCGYLFTMLIFIFILFESARGIMKHAK